MRLFLTELAARKTYYGFMTAILERERVLEVRRHTPVPSARGKLLPFLRFRDPAALPDALRA